MTDWQTLLALLLAIGLAARFVYKLKQRHDSKRLAAERLFRNSLALLENPRFEKRESAGYPLLSGHYQGLPVQILPVVDMLAVRKLPALWLLVTVQDRLPLKARLDLMMRPNAATTFSNFDQLPATVETPAGFPEHAVIKTDDPGHMLPPHVIAGHLDLFERQRAKELLITPNGLRIVWLLAEADRARYGVLRQAEFGEPELDPALLRDLLDRLIAIRQSILDWQKRTA